MIITKRTNIPHIPQTVARIGMGRALRVGDEFTKTVKWREYTGTARYRVEKLTPVPSYCKRCIVFECRLQEVIGLPIWR